MDPNVNSWYFQDPEEQDGEFTYCASMPILLGHGRGDDDVDSKPPEIQYILLDNKFFFLNLMCFCSG